MNLQVWKFELTQTIQGVNIPKGSEILSVQVQRGIICLWALVNPENEIEERLFETFGTGHNIFYDMGVERKYLDTVQSAGLVFHIFERIS